MEDTGLDLLLEVLRKLGGGGHGVRPWAQQGEVDGSADFEPPPLPHYTEEKTEAKCDGDWLKVAHRGRVKIPTLFSLLLS